MGDEEQAQAGGGAGGKTQEITVVTGGLVCQGVVKVVAGKRWGPVRGVRRAGARTPELALKAVEILTDAGFKLGQVEQLLSGACAVPRRTLSDIKKRTRERRSAKIVAEAVAKAKAAQKARAVEEEQARVAASINQSWETFGSK